MANATISYSQNINYFKKGKECLYLRDSTLNDSIDCSRELKCKYGECIAIATSTGSQCLHCVSNQGDYYCWQHSGSGTPIPDNSTSSSQGNGDNRGVSKGTCCAGLIVVFIGSFLFGMLFE